MSPSTAWAGIDKDADSTKVKYGRGAPISNRVRKMTKDDDFDALPLVAGDVPYGWCGFKGTDATAAKPTVPGSVTAPGSMPILGAARLVTGADAAGTMATNGTRLESGRMWRVSTGDLVMETRVRMPSAVTNLSMFFGLSQQAGSLVMPLALDGSDVMTAGGGVTDLVGFLFDTAAATDNWWAGGVNASTVTKQDLALAPTATFVYVLRIEIDASGNARHFIDGKQVGSEMAAAINPAISQIGFVAAVFSRNNESKTVDIDYALIEGNRI